MYKARLIFILLSVYILAAFGWWTYAHYDNIRRISLQQKDVLEMRCYKATFDINGAIDQQLFDDTLGLHTFFDANYPDLEVIFLNINDPLNNFMVRPRLSSYEEIQEFMDRKTLMYEAEGVVMILLLLMGMMVIFRSFSKELSIKRLQANFLLSVTHELKTPLTAMKLYMETLLRRTMTPEQTRTIAENSLNETQRLQDQVEMLLLSAQLDSHKYHIQPQSINLSELIEELIAGFNRPRHEEEWVRTEIQQQVIAKVDPTAMEMILNNLLTNAMKYAGTMNGVTVKLSQTKTHIHIQVSDLGPGISDEDKRLLFSKFFRAGDENTRKTKGTGLGLFIVKHLVDLHHGKIEVHNNQPKGTIFDIKLEADAE